MAKASETYSNSKSSDDYNPLEVVHELANNINQPDKFAEIFCTAAKKQKIIDDCLKGIVKELVQSDKATRDLIRLLVAEQLKDDLKFTLKKVGAVGGSILLLLIGALFQTVCTKWLK